MVACSAPVLALAVALAAALPGAHGQAAPVVSFLNPQQKVAALETLGPNQAAVRQVESPLVRGTPSWGAYLTAPDAEDATVPGPTTGTAILYLTDPETLGYNITLDRGFDSSDPLQSILLSVPQFINSSAVTLGYLYGSNDTTRPIVSQAPGVNGTVHISGTVTPAPGIGFSTLVWNMSSGHAVLNLYTADYPQPAEPMGCCNNAEVKSDGFLEPLNAAALPLGGLRQDHHGYEGMPVSPSDAIPYHATLMPMEPGVNSSAGGLINLLVAPDNSSITYNVTLGGLAPGNEIYNVSVWFGTGAARQLGWYPYSLYSFASSRLPTPRGGLLAPNNGANFTLATGWIGKFVDTTAGSDATGAASYFDDPTYDFGVTQLLIGNVYIIIGTADYPNGELQGHAVLGWAAESA